MKLFSQILGARTLVTALGQTFFWFPTMGHTSSKIIYFEPIRVFGRFTWHPDLAPGNRSDGAEEDPGQENETS
jgi:hypothetical protein